MPQPVAQLVYVGSEFLIDEGLVGEVHDKRLVLRIRSLNQIQRALVYRRSLARHGPRVVHHDGDRNRQVSVLKADQRLLHAVLADREIFPFQVGNHPVAVEHGAVQHHLFHILAQNKPSTFPFQRPIRASRRLGIRRTQWVAVHRERRSLCRSFGGGSLLRRQPKRHGGQKNPEDQMIARAIIAMAHSSRCEHGQSAEAIPVED